MAVGWYFQKGTVAWQHPGYSQIQADDGSAPNQSAVERDVARKPTGYCAVKPHHTIYFPPAHHAVTVLSVHNDRVVKRTASIRKDETHPGNEFILNSFPVYFKV